MSAIAFVHDWINGLRGGERCLLAFLLLYKDSKIYSLFYTKAKSHQLIDQNFRKASILNKIPYSSKLYKLMLPFYPLFSLLKVDPCSQIISLSHAAAKNISKPNNKSANIKHICYCFTPMRYIWDQAKVYLGIKRFIFWPLILILRTWDKSCSKNVDNYVCISKFVAARIRRFYGRDSFVVYPPVAKNWINHQYARKPSAIAEGQPFFLFASALVPYKGAEIALRACKNLNLPLYIAGDGPEYSKLALQADSNIKLLGKVTDAELAYLLLNCRALIFPCKEDFGILPIEAQFAGKPVIALYAGACKETISGFKSWELTSEAGVLQSDNEFNYSGVFISNSKSAKQLLINTEIALKAFLRVESSFSPDFCKKSAQRFSTEAFYDSWSQFVVSINSQILQVKPDKASFVNEFEQLRITFN